MEKILYILYKSHKGLNYEIKKTNVKDIDDIEELQEDIERKNPEEVDVNILNIIDLSNALNKRLFVAFKYKAIDDSDGIGNITVELGKDIYCTNAKGEDKEEVYREAINNLIIGIKDYYNDRIENVVIISLYELN